MYILRYIEFCWFSPNFSGYFTCTEGYCVEIYDLKCERRCDSKEFDMRGKNSVIFSGEKIIIADCSAQSTATDSRLNSVHFCYNYLTLWWVEFQFEVTWLFTNRFRGFYLICKINQILLKIYFLPILLTFMYLVALCQKIEL